MLELIHNAEQKALNIISLSDLLDGTDTRFRKAVIRALEQEGFELNDPLPCLQHPVEMLEAIDWLETLDFGTPWEAFASALSEAGRTGILVDLRRRNQFPHRTDRRLPPVQPDRFFQHSVRTY